MGAMASAPVELVHIQRSNGGLCRAAAAQMQGWRNTHEDAHFMEQEKDNWSHFGVLDGHGGTKAARLASKELPKRLFQATKGRKGVQGVGVEKVKDAFTDTDAWLKERMNNGKEESGSTCVTAGIRRQGDGKFACFIANAGDSRGVLIRRKDRVVVASEDHKPDRADEKERIVAAGGYVTAPDGPEGCARLDASLAVSRSFADFQYKQGDDKKPSEQKVSCVPELYFNTLDSGDIVLLACDGIFDVMTTDELVDFVLARVESGKSADLGAVAAEVLRECLRKESKDNMTLIIAEVGTGFSEEPVLPDEIQGLEKFETIEDEAVKSLYQKFLEYCTECGTVPDEVRAILDSQKKAAPAPKSHATGLSTKERLQHKLQDRQKAKENEGPPKDAQKDSVKPDVRMDMDDIDALAAFVAGDRELPAYPPQGSPSKKKNRKKKSPNKNSPGAAAETVV
jgi:serine/threonine protein phosphatase PrpC